MLRINSSLGDFLKIISIILLITFSIIIKDIIALVFIAVIFTSALNPIVDALESRNIPRPLAVMTILAGVISTTYLLFNLLIPPLIIQTQNLIGAVPDLIEGVSKQFNLGNSLQNRYDNLSATGVNDRFLELLNNNFQSILELSSNIFNILFKAITVVVLTYYLLVEHGSIQDFFGNFFDGKNREKFNSLWAKVEHKLGVWLRGQLAVMFLIGVITYFGLSIIGLPFALPLSIIAGLLEIIPIIGPTISVVPALFIAISTLSPITIVSVLVLYLLVQQMENIFIVPRVMQQAVGLNPILVILAVMVGNRIGGVMGTFLSVPISAILLIGFLEWKQLEASKKSKIENINS
jgi:predicted PurR-regulated permease PerM